MRGKHDRHVKRLLIVRITPAGAGKTRFSCPLHLYTEDHPRRCGENRVRLEEHLCGLGSPPQVRGKLIHPAFLTAQAGITPAGAGKTTLAQAAAKQRWDHPRRCGENLQARRDPQSLPGSPPQVRGKHFCVPKRRFCTRITPAGAGKTGFSRPLPLA